VTGPALGMRPVTNVADLPTTTFGHRSIAWWGTIGFIVIEGTTLFICAMSYLYLRVTVGQWAPAYAPLPSLGVAAVQVALMVGSNIPMVMVDRAARRLDLPAVRAGMVVISLLAVVMCVLRGFELAALNVRWDDNAYGTAAWAILVSHATLLLVETIETLVQTALMFSPKLEQRDISAIADNALYWYFMTGVWVPLAAIAFLTPYIAGR
jgi:heme/copper-type cytochrome/quinol oxidase subunit 3